MQFKEVHIPLRQDKIDDTPELSPEKYYYYSNGFKTLYIHKNRKNYMIKGYGFLCDYVAQIPTGYIYSSNLTLENAVLLFNRMIQKQINNDAQGELYVMY